MKILFNGEEIEVEKGRSVADILQANGFGLKYVLVEVDDETVDHHKYHETFINDEGTELDCAYLVGGGGITKNEDG